jgi:hypothetical protein
MDNQTNLMLEQLTKANMRLDPAELIGIGDVKERCIAQAPEAEDRGRPRRALRNDHANVEAGSMPRTNKIVGLCHLCVPPGDYSG